MKRKILLVVLTVIIVLAWYGYREYTRTNKDISGEQAAFSIQASGLVSEFVADSAAASRKYNGRILSVSGTLRKADAQSYPAVLLFDVPPGLSTVKCIMDSSYAADYNKLQKGNAVKVKGRYAGYQHDELLGTDVILVQCVMENTK